MTTDLDLFAKGRGFPMGHLSPSFIAKYETCPLAALYYREGKPKVWDPRYAEQGRWTHSVIAQRYDPTAKIYDPECGVDNMMLTRHNESLKGYNALLKQDDRFRPSKRQHPEVHVTIEIAGVPLVGFIDLLTVGSCVIYIDDWKTGLYRAADEQQIRIYTMMVSQILGKPARDIIATLDYLRNEPRKIQRRVPFTSSAMLTQHIIEDVIKPINDLQFLPVKGTTRQKACDRCEYKHICDAW